MAAIFISKKQKNIASQNRYNSITDGMITRKTKPNISAISTTRVLRQTGSIMTNSFDNPKQKNYQAKVESQRNVLSKINERFNDMDVKFSNFSKQWREETKFVSSSNDRIYNDNYLKIIALGSGAIPLILKDLKDNGGFWFKALEILTDEQVIQDSDIGYTSRMKKAWLNWGINKGYID